MFSSFPCLCFFLVFLCFGRCCVPGGWLVGPASLTYASELSLFIICDLYNSEGAACWVCQLHYASQISLYLVFIIYLTCCTTVTWDERLLCFVSPRRPTLFVRIAATFVSISIWVLGVCFAWPEAYLQRGWVSFKVCSYCCFLFIFSKYCLPQCHT